eukprot:354303_1
MKMWHLLRNRFFVFLLNSNEQKKHCLQKLQYCMSQTHYFKHQGAIRHLSNQLNELDTELVLEGVIKVIDAITNNAFGTDRLFSDVIKSMGSYNDKLKKTVYLYLQKYSESQPQKAILCVGMLQKDSSNNPDPLMRSLAIRTMGNVKVHRITEYFCDPLNLTLKDPSWYVRKTSAIAVSKLFDFSTDLIEESGFIDILKKMLHDTHLNVVANAIAALSDMSESSGTDYFHYSDNILNHLLTTINESSTNSYFCTMQIISYWIKTIDYKYKNCNLSRYILCHDILSLLLQFSVINKASEQNNFEWGTVYALDSLSKFNANKKQAQYICERITPVLWSANNCAVMSAVQCILHFIDISENFGFYKRLEEPLIRLLSQPPEIQYVILKNINIIIQKYPNMFSDQNIKSFFIEYNDECYIKIEKLKILQKLITKQNMEKILNELTEYVQCVDFEFVRDVICTIG